MDVFRDVHFVSFMLIAPDFDKMDIFLPRTKLESVLIMPFFDLFE